MNKKFGILFRISGLPGSGKTELSKLIHPEINKIFGPTIMWSGDDLRKIFNNQLFSLKERNKFGIQNINLIKLINTQKINVIFATVGLNNQIRKRFNKEIPNYVEIIIKSQLDHLKKRKVRKFYNNNSKNVWGRDIKVEYPKKPDVLIKNDFKNDLRQIKLLTLDNLVKLKRLKNFIK
ncbi:adenylyl-sulfate kinase [Candidatus Pelagibacter ubique]|nr:adenylyl-sulfate kinase [Candidatus Pelagibacter ubique]